MFMRRKPNTVGGGSKTNLNGLRFEGRTDLLESLSLDTSFKLEEDDIKGTSKSCKIFKDDKYIGHYYEKHSFYNQYLELNDVDWKKLISKKYLPDSVFVNKNNNTVYIIEKKFQEGSGSVDEKLQTCDFKKKIYERLLKTLNVRVKFYYILNDWFTKDEYSDVFGYIDEVGCKKFINFIPFEELGIK